MGERHRTAQRTVPGGTPHVDLDAVAQGVRVAREDLDRALYALGEGPESLGRALHEGDPHGVVHRLARLLDRRPRALALTLCDALEAPPDAPGEPERGRAAVDARALGPMLSASAAWLGARGADEVAERARRVRRWTRGLAGAAVVMGLATAMVGLLGLAAPDPMGPWVWTVLTLGMTVGGVVVASAAVVASGFVAGGMDRVEDAASAAGSKPAQLALQLLLEGDEPEDALRRILDGDR